MSRTQWWSLTALLAVVLGLLCGPTAFASAGPGTPAAPVAPVAQAQTLVAEAEADAPAPVAEATGERAPVPGCGKLRDHDGEPAVPSRARSAHDHAPGLAPWGLPAATGALPAEPPPGIRARAPVPYTPTPVELSVLRV
ncbi:hypothetical protein YW5DRAFT_06419 [Streptomyces sp. Ncost-T6T-1]|uniref:hypothetical protein n=1 Tax=Streptomyces sp. Ncost-T6T-1 TaxID=1100828 RepID=UPI000805C401|nr:hypothetical protein [Streptomyces sp. Ncost-T6T-1]SBV00822.1 hypothetical protein YW5DRAFT_06419 [Streptomyces sp. Ncost-T6T-1]